MKASFVNRKFLFVSFLIASLFLAGFLGFQLALSSFSGSEESVPKFLESTLPYSYIIDTNGTHYFMYNGTTWKKDWSSTDASAIGNAIVGNCSGGGTYFWKSGTYDFSSPITVTEGGHEFVGAGWSTIFRSTGGNILEFKVTSGWFKGIYVGHIKFDTNNNDVNCIATDRFQNGVIEGCWFSGSTSSKYLLRLDDFDSWNIRDNYFRHFYYALWLGTSGTGGFPESGTTTITRNRFASFRDNSVAINLTGVVTSRVRIRDNLFEGDTPDHTNQKGIVMCGFANSIVGNSFEALDANCIELGRLNPDVDSTGHLIQDNRFEVPSGYGIEMKMCYNIKIIDNDFSLTGDGKAIHVNHKTSATRKVWIERNTFPTTDAIVFESGKGDYTILKDNINFVTESTISFSSISNGTYVAHGLAGTPDKVIITLSVQGYAWYGTLNATHVQIYGSIATLSGSMYCKHTP